MRDGDAVGSVSPDPARLLAAARQFGREMEQLRLIQGMSWRQIDEAVQGQPGVSGSESTFYRMVKTQRECLNPITSAASSSRLG